ncbi:alpha-L-arabinofuranosidase C-terminal domain-containing protein [Bifidobacterium platyrrhinorum]|uniref:non-reducing end alpha-L-arabinofuranosidase n=1 Tax=Bifidobacterium platyrrhinorum TaxID=2661628 RepID=A0A6L9SUA1_9BIFI|nr:alpha-L-arabinofuranosidase C-terminal domain-containing protein [Bifidobacterium platyrrhinorum]NEG56014.1 alpha-L-arabinofuranosidase [Bifidobacterium platyrrhinorum]
MTSISVGAAVHPVGDRLYGAFFEDINLGADGGLNANMVNNYSFDGVWLDHHTLRPQGGERWRTQADPLRFWRFDGCDATSCGAWIRGPHGQEIDTPGECPAPPVHRNSRYARVRVAFGVGTPGNPARVGNLGYNGGGAYADMPAMSVVRGRTYEFRCMLRPVDGVFDGRFCTVAVVDRYGLPLAGPVPLRRARVEPDRDGWYRVAAELTGSDTGLGALRIEIVGEADDGGRPTLDMDLIELMDADHWGAGDPKWRHGKLRRDMVEALAALKPRFLRFPGGCIVEGVTPGNEYRWKDTVGALAARRQQYSLWSFKTPDGSSYSQSYQIGFYEYFCLCEDLGARPLPTLFAGIACQSPGRDPRHMPTDAPAFRANVVRDYLDLIDFANGDPDRGGWAAVRRDMGHPEPFGMDMIGVGNENFGADYVEKFDIIARAVHEKDPDMLCVMSAGLFPFRPAMRRTWKHAHAVAAGGFPGVGRIPAGAGGPGAGNAHEAGARPVEAGARLVPQRGVTARARIVVDEHSYHSPEWFVAQSSRFDDYPRDGTAVYFGEYSANGYFAGRPQRPGTANTWRTALAEAAFLTGCERNSDVVAMTSYAPLFAHVTAKGWQQNLIEFSPARVAPTLNYEVERLFSTHVGEWAYECRVGGVAGGAAGGYPPMGDGPYVSVTGGDDPFVRYVKLVNTGGGRVDVSIDMARGLRALGAGGDGLTMEVETLAAGPDERNSFSLEGPMRDVLRRRTRASRIGRGAHEFALALDPYSVTLVTLR